jgi:hypothetical protein
MGWKPERIFPISESAESASLQPPPTTMDDIPSQDESSTPSESSMPAYRDVIHPNHDNTTSRGMPAVLGEDETTISTLTAATILPSEMPLVAVAAEHVHVLDGENANPDGDDETDGYFTKNTQQVIID